MATVSSRPSAVDSAAAMPPTATRQVTQYGRPPMSGAASTITSPAIISSPNCSSPSPLTSRTDTRLGSSRDQRFTQAGSSSKGSPTTCCSTSNLTSTASAGAAT